MHHRPQFGMRENPASDRRHGSRQVARTPLDRNGIEGENVTSSPHATAQNQLAVNSDDRSTAATLNAATGGKKDDTGTHPALAMLSRSHAEVLSEFEPLISTCEAARLLGNIHVKTLQRYARHRRIPGYQIGGHWYFRASELDAWLRTQINLSCHPCRLQEKSDGT
jgi:excisionase family DNA binding protein